MAMCANDLIVTHWKVFNPDWSISSFSCSDHRKDILYQSSAPCVALFINIIFMFFKLYFLVRSYARWGDSEVPMLSPKPENVHILVLWKIRSIFYMFIYICVTVILKRYGASEIGPLVVLDLFRTMINHQWKKKLTTMDSFHFRIHFLKCQVKCNKLPKTRPVRRYEKQSVLV